MEGSTGNGAAVQIRGVSKGFPGVRAAVALLRHQSRPRNENTGAVMVTRANLNNPVVRQFVTPRCGSPHQVDVG